MARAAADAILAHAARAYPLEVCGLLLGSGEAIEEAHAAENVAATPHTRFEIDPAALFAAYRQARRGGPAILGYYHSHPAGDPLPSATDAARAAPDGKLWLIAGQGRIAAFVAGRAGIHGRFRPILLTID